MAKADDIERGLAVFSTVIGAIDPVTGGVAAVAKEAMGRWLKRREELAGEVFSKELRQAGTFAQLERDADGPYVRMARYVHAARIGAAHKNLKILARLVIYGDGSRPIVPDEFLSLALTIESLRPDELVVLAAIIRERQRREKLNAMDIDKDLRTQVMAGLRGSFPNSEIEGLFGALQRTGFVYAGAGNDAGGWFISPLLMRLEATVQFAEAVSSAEAG